ncbi:MAG: hypothetical protein U0Q11_13870 [Vicinamibacterales bacterium]
MTTESIPKNLDAASMALETLAADDAEALEALHLASERIRSLESDIVVYRTMAQEGIHAMSRLLKERDSARAQVARLRDELRAYRTPRRVEEAA